MKSDVSIEICPGVKFVLYLIKYLVFCGEGKGNKLFLLLHYCHLQAHHSVLILR